MGHYANECPNNSSSNPPIDKSSNTEQKRSGQQGFSFTQHEYNFTSTAHTLNSSWVLLDTQSSCDIFKNENLLENVQSCEGAGLKLVSNGNGVLETKMKGTVKGYGHVWYHP